MTPANRTEGEGIRTATAKPGSGAASGWDYVGPCKIDCEQKCDVPDGVTLSPVPRPRHNWPDCIHCPNCERSFLIIKRSSPNDTSSATAAEKGHD